MKIRLLFILALSFITTFSITAQTRTVTNTDLEKFRQKRLAAERDLRENYERLGFPSPAELEKQIEQSRRERSELAERLRAENLERERITVERQRAENEARRKNYSPSSNDNYSDRSEGLFFNYGYAPFGYYNFPNNGFYNYRNFGLRRNRGNFRFNQPRIEYRNNLPVLIQPSPRTIAVQSGGRN
jgi:hypothetical protein